MAQCSAPARTAANLIEAAKLAFQDFRTCDPHAIDITILPTRLTIARVMVETAIAYGEASTGAIRDAFDLGLPYLRNCQALLRGPEAES